MEEVQSTPLHHRPALNERQRRVQVRPQSLGRLVGIAEQMLALHPTSTLVALSALHIDGGQVVAPNRWAGWHEERSWTRPQRE
jgi:hypothetical protein